MNILIAIISFVGAAVALGLAIIIYTDHRVNQAEKRIDNLINHISRAQISIDHTRRLLVTDLDDAMHELGFERQFIEEESMISDSISYREKWVKINNLLISDIVKDPNNHIGKIVAVISKYDEIFYRVEYENSGKYLDWLPEFLTKIIPGTPTISTSSENTKQTWI